MSETIRIRNLALNNTIEILESVLNVCKDENISIFLKPFLRASAIAKLSEMWEQQNDVLNIGFKINELMPHINKDIYFNYKVAECINYIRYFSATSKEPIFFLN